MSRKSDGRFGVSNTEMQVFKQCKRRWFLQYYLKLRRRRENYRGTRQAGIVVHEALDVFYKSGAKLDGLSHQLMLTHLNDVRDSDLAMAEPHELAEVKETHEFARIIVDGYVDWLRETGADEPYEWTGSEDSLEVDGPIEGTFINGILDLQGVHKRTGDLVILDNKVVKDFHSMIKTLGQNEQAPLYAILSKAQGHDPNRGFRVIWSMLRKVKRSGRAKPPFYQRYELVINPDQLKLFWTQLYGQLKDMLELEHRLDNGESHFIAAYPTPTKDCSWSCPFYLVCPLMNDPRTDSQFIFDSYYEITPSREAVEETQEETPDE